jgi:hypothetical protein
VLRYLGRYTHRVAIANSRLVDVTDSAVSFRTKQGKVLALEPVEFLRRFIQHVLPNGFHKIRHYGLYSASSAHKRELARRCLSTEPEPAAERSHSMGAERSIEQLRATTDPNVPRCPSCGALLARRPLPRQHAPPRRRPA